MSEYVFCSNAHCTYVVRTNLQGLLLPHEKADFLVTLVLKQLDLPHAPLLPFSTAALLVKAIEFALAAQQSAF